MLETIPMAVIEYTETKENAVMGRRKANRVANKLEAKYGLLPVIYYTNGYMIYIIDQLGFAPRRIFCFHSLEELITLIQKRGKEADLSNIKINDAITDRKYQHEAINTVCQSFAAKNRGSLIVMATGTGKTRVAISIVDVMMRSGMAKNILFLADRTSLIRQAQKNFKKLIPNITTSLFSGESVKRNFNANIIFDTYQTLIKMLNADTRSFGVGRFDLIIVDEAHRSVFSKYGYIFKYFDALMLGLTATPKFEQDKNVYEVFKLGKNEPDYAYELEIALSDGYLVGFSVKDRTTELLRRGFKYKDLAANEIADLEAAVATDYSGKMFTRFKEGFGGKGNGVRAKVINRGTIREMLDDLMTNGLKLQTGVLGKTIIFAESHKEAEVIVEEFNNRYGAFGPNFCKLVYFDCNDVTGTTGNFMTRLFYISSCLTGSFTSANDDLPTNERAMYYISQGDTVGTALYKAYLKYTVQVTESCADRNLPAESMVIGTSAIIDTEIDGAIGMNSGIFNNPFIIWGKYRKKLFRYYLPISFQFHHTQMDGAHAGRFLANFQNEINRI